MDGATARPDRYQCGVLDYMAWLACYQCGKMVRPLRCQLEMMQPGRSVISQGAYAPAGPLQLLNYALRPARYK